MSIPAKRPCRICRRWFRPDVRVGARQHTCSRPECQAARRKKTQAAWRTRNPGYSVAWRIQARAESARAPGPSLRLPSPLSNLPWDMAHEEFSRKGADFIGAMGALLLQAAKDQFEGQVVDSSRDPGTLPPSPAKDQFQTQLIDSA
jgi:hypothetical protein